MPKFGHFRLKSINFLILTKFRMCPILNVLISNLSFVFKNFEPKSLNFGILSQKILTFSQVPHFEGGCFKFDIGFQKLWAQIPKFQHFWPKSINFLILTKISLSYFEGGDFKSDFRVRKFWNFITSLIKINYFIFWFYVLN